MKEKMTPEGTIEKVKACLVAGGDQQDKSIYTLDETLYPPQQYWSPWLSLLTKEDT